MMNDELPQGWVATRLDALGQIQLGKMLDRAKNTGTTIPYLRNINVRWFSFALSDLKEVLVSEDEKERFSVRDGDLFICEGGEPGRCAVWRNGSNEMVYQKALHRFRTNGAIIPELLMHRLRLEAEVGTLHESFTGTTIKHLTRETLVKYEVPLPPLAEQKRIADKLEAVLGRVDACRARLDRVPDLLKRFRQSVLAAATSGQLTEDWREENGCGSKPWGESNLGHLCEKNRIITYGVIKLGDETPNGVPCLRTSNVRWLRIDTTGMKRIAKSLSADYSRTILQGGEVLVNVRGTLGGVAVAEEHMAGWNVSREVAVLPVDKKRLIPAFLAFSIGSDATQRWLGRAEKGVAYTGINIEDLRELPVKIPTLPEQGEIVRRVETLFALADRIEARLATAQRLVERLTPATLSKAFRGDLVPQDPNDEPASQLLERLGTTDSGPKARKRVPQASATPQSQLTLGETHLDRGRTE
jgi:type I restriction enzyme, S subunit